MHRTIRKYLSIIRRKVNPFPRQVKGLDAELFQDILYSRGRLNDLYPADIQPDERAIIDRCRPYTMTSIDRLMGLLRAMDHIHHIGIEGDMVECGVWRGGSMLAVAQKCIQHKNTSRQLFLFDTFEGMTAPDHQDLQYDGINAEKFLQTNEKGEKQGAYWCMASLEDVQTVMAGSGYPNEKITYVKGPVEETLPHSALTKIALLRLDTDWYQSTMHELQTLFDLVSPGGIIIIDDYGHWQGAQKAVDEFLEARNIRTMLHRLDYTGRLMVKE